MIGFYTGLRISEAFGLTWDDIDFENRMISVNKQIVKRNLGADVRKVVEKKGKKEHHSSWYFGTPKTNTSTRIVPFGETLYQALKQGKATQLKNEIKYEEYYTIHVAKSEIHEKWKPMIRVVPLQKCAESPLQRIRLVCINESGQYTSPDSFKYCSRVIHHEMQLAFDYHSLRHTHATMLIEAGANVKNVPVRLGHTDIRTANLCTWYWKNGYTICWIVRTNHTRKNFTENSPTNKGESLNYRQWFTLILWFISYFLDCGGKWVANPLNCIKFNL